MASLRVEQKHNALYLIAEGDLTMESSESMRDAIFKALLDSDLPVCALDLGGVAFIDSTGLGLLVSMSTRLRGLGKRLCLVRPSAQVLKLLELVQLSTFFCIFDDEDDMQAGLPL